MKSALLLSVLIFVSVSATLGYTYLMDTYAKGPQSIVPAGGDAPGLRGPAAAAEPGGASATHGAESASTGRPDSPHEASPPASGAHDTVPGAAVDVPPAEEKEPTQPPAVAEPAATPAEVSNAEAAARAAAAKAEADRQAAALKESDAHLRGAAAAQGGAGTPSPAPAAQFKAPRRQAAAGVPGITADVEKQAAVKKAFEHAWGAYKKYAWGADMVKPVTKSSSNDANFQGMGLTLIDSLDTLWIMGMEEDFARARDWVADNVKMGGREDKKHRSVNLFEVTIRVIGGLLSAYDLSGDVVFLNKARDVADQFIVAFDSPTGVPYSTIDLETKRAFNPSWSSGATSISEVSSLQLEWEYLSHATGDSRYRDVVRKVMLHLHDIEPQHSLYPMFIKPESGKFHKNDITLGARADSLYEYLLKQVLQQEVLAERDAGAKAQKDMVAGMWERSVAGIENMLLKRNSDGFLYVQERYGQQARDKMDHLVCFLPGVMALGSRVTGMQQHLDEAKELVRTCYEFYNAMPTGLSPEICRFPDGGPLIADPGAKHSLLRPETVESLFVLYRVTGDAQYREWGWNIFQSFEEHARVQTGGYSSIKDVTKVPPILTDSQESFFLAETLKYLYLLFSDGDVIPLDQYVFNTEAHPLSVFT